MYHSPVDASFSGVVSWVGLILFRVFCEAGLVLMKSPRQGDWGVLCRLLAPKSGKLSVYWGEDGLNGGDCEELGEKWWSPEELLNLELLDDLGVWEWELWSELKEPGGERVNWSFLLLFLRGRTGVDVKIFLPSKAVDPWWVSFLNSSPLFVC